MVCEGFVEDELASGDDLGRTAMVQIRRRQQRDAGVVLLVVVPIEKFREDCAGVLEHLSVRGTEPSVALRAYRGRSE